jgi:hypothetical protein
MVGGRFMSISINITWDDEASVYVAVCDRIGLALESESYDKLICRVKDAVPELLELNNINDCSSISFLTGERQVACV